VRHRQFIRKAIRPCSRVAFSFPAPAAASHMLPYLMPVSRYPTPRRRNRLPKPDRRRALELLASCGVEGCSEHVLRAHGFTTEQMVELVRSGLATATPQRVRAGRDTMEVGTLRITEAGRAALAAKV
jgi:hypothetical protein